MKKTPQQEIYCTLCELELEAKSRESKTKNESYFEENKRGIQSPIWKAIDLCFQKVKIAFDRTKPDSVLILHHSTDTLGYSNTSFQGQFLPIDDQRNNKQTNLGLVRASFLKKNRIVGTHRRKWTIPKERSSFSPKNSRHCFLSHCLLVITEDSW